MKLLTFGSLLLIFSGAVFGQEPNPTQAINQQSGTSNQQNPIFKVEVVSRSIAAISYRNRSGSTKVDFQGTSLAPKAKGRAEVTSRLGHTEVKVEIKDLPAARQFGPLFLTYVLWAITPDGRPANLGEVVVSSGGDFKATVTTDFQACGLIVTAEPYFGVRQPSDVVVMENIVRNDTLGKIGAIDAKYELLPRGQYEYRVPENQLKPVDLNADKKSPLAVYEAVNAVQIAQYAKSDQYAADIYTDAAKLLKQAQDYRDRKQWGPSIMTAKEAVQKAEDARTISLRRQRDEALQQERAKPRKSRRRLTRGQGLLTKRRSAPRRKQTPGMKRTSALWLTPLVSKRMPRVRRPMQKLSKRSRRAPKRNAFVYRPKTRRTNYASSCCSNSMPCCLLVKRHAALSSICRTFCSTPVNMNSSRLLGKLSRGSPASCSRIRA
jgi:hypothetical protein